MQRPNCLNETDVFSSECVPIMISIDPLLRLLSVWFLILAGILFFRYEILISVSLNKFLK